MIKNLVIVESPAKAKTIGKFLGKDFKVLSSYGHIRDLKTNDFSIDIENKFEPTYEIPSDKKKIVSELKKAAKEADTVWLASDEDREGEAISWHLYEVLGLKPEETRRIVFHEITKTAITGAIENPRHIDINLVNAQQARRILDRIVGFELSPVLWRKIKPQLSAGRVQSVAVRLIVEREREVQNFESKSSYRVTAVFDLPEGGTIKAELGKRFATAEEAQLFLQACATGEFTIDKIEKKPAKRYPAPPFTTSTLQQEASRKLGYPVARTMMIAQSLYEKGLITYMRTDSVNLSSLAINTCKETITELMGEEYVHPRQFATKTKGAQEAHEAIRPTFVANTSIEGTNQEQRLYELIWKRTVASQMSEALLERTTATIGVSGREEEFKATGQMVKFDGFLKVYRESFDDEEEERESSSDDRLLPPIEEGMKLRRNEIKAEERFTQQPSRFTEASLVRKLEELGIGRPSTYAPTISTIQNRDYVEKRDVEGTEREYNVLTLKGEEIKTARQTEMAGRERHKLVPTDVGTVVNDFLTEFFPVIMDYNFTAKVEGQFDIVAEGKEDWTSMLDDFYKGFHPLVETAMNTKKSEIKIGERYLGDHPESGRPVIVKIGRYGPVIQVGSGEDEDEKPKFARMPNNSSMETITLEEAVKATQLPRELGEYQDKEVSIGAGRFGPYVRHDNKFVSIPKGTDPLKITYEEAVELIKAKIKKDAENTFKVFEEEGVKVLNGRFGPYISYKRKNYKIPKETDPKELTLEDCMKLIEEAKEDKKKGRTTSKKKPAAKKKTTKKAAAKKTTAKKKTAAKTEK